MVVGADTTAPPASDMPGDMGAAAGAEAVAPDAPMRETSARRAATPRGRALPPTAVGAGGSPPASARQPGSSLKCHQHQVVT